MRKYKPFPNRFVRITIEDKSAGNGEPVIIEGSANYHPYIDPNKPSSPEVLKMESKARPRIEFDCLSDIAQSFPSGQIKIFNFPVADNPLLKLDKNAKVKLEAGYNGYALNTILEGYLTSEPFTSPDFPNNYTLLQVATRSPDAMTEKDISLPEKKVSDFISAIESNWNVILKFSKTGEMGNLLNADLNLTLKSNLEEALEYLKSLIQLNFVNEDSNIFQGYFLNGERSQAGSEMPREITEGIIKFEFLFKAKEKLEKNTVGNDYIPQNFSSKSYFEKAEEKEYQIEASINRPYFTLDNPKLKKSKQRQTDAKMQLFLQGGFRIGSFIEFQYKKVKHVFSIKSINIIGNTHGSGADFRTDLELYVI